MRIQGTMLAFCVLIGATGGSQVAEAAPGNRSAPRVSQPARATQAVRPATRPQRQLASRPQASRPHGARALRAGHNASQGHATGQRRGRTGLRVSSSGGLSCVPYARMVTGMQVSGNGGDWWSNASGLYARGQRPEPGSVFTFRRSGGMSSGHVAVVERVVGPRHILIDHANWAGPGIRRGTVMRNVHVVDVSENNDWTSVRVQVGHDSASFGRTYPTYGFIYNRPDYAGTTTFASGPLRRTASFEQVAEVPESTPVAMTPQDPARRASARR